MSDLAFLVALVKDPGAAPLWAVAGGAATKAFDWLLARRKHADTVGSEYLKVAQQGQENVVKHLFDLVETLKKDIEDLRKELASCEERHSNAEDRVRRLRDEIHSLRNTMQRMGMQVDEPRSLPSDPPTD